jgi:transcriptional regulator with XRE-family HTH domain
MQVARSVRSLRVARFLTQEDLARIAGIGRATLVRIEAGATAPHMRTIRALAKALEVEPGQLVEDPSGLWRS